LWSDDPRDADLLAAGGRPVLVEGRWSTGGGLSAAETVALVEATGRPVELTRLRESVYWGRDIIDERYVVHTRPVAC
jgi:hypothetical protein